ncbi:phosphatase PAP2 family protein [Sphingomonas sp. M1-B02]|uniref:phosphatase PAP2 family protein n=1 Tax=Sphingomonas sp. M1-B02 TaxID=3114300 RepID=UPI00223EA91A|nr:phosphatase PAP2 family protein [Sphingomonas sp. S6-11]UZK64829.1 phosphatase PAP2 family protein [Sphingomonas sp. S6-11]
MHEVPDSIEPLVSLNPRRRPSLRVPWPMVFAAAIALIFAVMIWFGMEVREGDGADLDREIMLAMRVPGHPEQPIGPAWLPSAVRDVTALGSSTVLTFVVAATCLFLAMRGRMRSALLVLAATILGSSAVTVVKALVARTRPDLFEKLMAEASHSFPSGHAANSAIVYLTIATLLFPVVQERSVRAFLLGAALALVGAIGVSRVYLGVHWPSDVAAGWAFGSIWALLWWQIELRVIRRAP